MCQHVKQRARRVRRRGAQRRLPAVSTLLVAVVVLRRLPSALAAAGLLSLLLPLPLLLRILLLLLLRRLLPPPPPRAGLDALRAARRGAQDVVPHVQMRQVALEQQRKRLGRRAAAARERVEEGLDHAAAARARPLLVAGALQEGDQRRDLQARRGAAGDEGQQAGRVGVVVGLQLPRRRVAGRRRAGRGVCGAGGAGCCCCGRRQGVVEPLALAAEAALVAGRDEEDLQRVHGRLGRRLRGGGWGGKASRGPFRRLQQSGGGGGGERRRRMRRPSRRHRVSPQL